MTRKRGKNTNATGNANASADSDKTRDPEELLEKAKSNERVRSFTLQQLLELPPTRKVEYRDTNKALGLSNPRAAEAVVAQSVGTLATPACDRCEKKYGNFTECIVVAGYFHEACANCQFGHVGLKCSLRRREDESNQKGPSKRPRSEGDAEEGVPDGNKAVETGRLTRTKKRRLIGEPVEDFTGTERGVSWYANTSNTVEEPEKPYLQHYVQQDGPGDLTMDISRPFTQLQISSLGMFNQGSVEEEGGPSNQPERDPFVNTSNDISNKVTWQRSLPDRSVEMEDRPNNSSAQPQIPNVEMSNIGSVEEDNWVRNQHVPASWYFLEDETVRDFFLRWYPSPPAPSPPEDTNADTPSTSPESPASWFLRWLKNGDKPDDAQ